MACADGAPSLMTGVALYGPARRPDLAFIDQISGGAPRTGQYHDETQGSLGCVILGSLIFPAVSRRPIAALISSEPPSSPAPAALRLQSVVVRKAAGDAETAAISFDVVAGGAHVLTGETGSGKTAILQMIGLAMTPARGGLQLFGQDVARVPRPARHALRRRIGMIFQDLKLVDGLSAADNVVLAVQAAGRDSKGVAREIGEVLSWVGLGQRRHAMAGALDDDGRRRLALARAVINRPDLVIADEPAGKTGQAILALLADLNQAGTAILLATRDRSLAANAGAEVTHLSRARPEAGGRP